MIRGASASSGDTRYSESHRLGHMVMFLFSSPCGTGAGKLFE